MYADLPTCRSLQSARLNHQLAFHSSLAVLLSTFHFSLMLLTLSLVRHKAIVFRNTSAVGHGPPLPTPNKTTPDQETPVSFLAGRKGQAVSPPTLEILRISAPLPKIHRIDGWNNAHFAGVIELDWVKQLRHPFLKGETWNLVFLVGNTSWKWWTFHGYS